MCLSEWNCLWGSPALANALEIAHIKALELAEYEKSIDAEIEAFRKKDEV